MTFFPRASARCRGPVELETVNDAKERRAAICFRSSLAQRLKVSLPVCLCTCSTNVRSVSVPVSTTRIPEEMNRSASVP